MGKFGKVSGKISKGLGRAGKSSKSKSSSPKNSSRSQSPKSQSPKNKVSFKNRASSAAKKVKKSSSKLANKVKKSASKVSKKLKSKKSKGRENENEESQNQEDEFEQEGQAGKRPTKSKKKQKRSKDSGSGPSRNKVGIKYQIFAVLLAFLIVLSIIGLILTAVLHLLGQRYRWNSLGGKRILMIFSLTGITSSVSLLLCLAIMIFELGRIKEKKLSGLVAILTMGALGLLFIGTLGLFTITILQQSEVMDIFGDQFLSLINDFETDPTSRLVMNRIQIEFECCGHYEPLDWALDDEENQNPEVLNVPFTCCSIHTLLPCLHDEIPLGNYEEFRAGETIYSVGCKYPMEKWYKSIIIYYELVAAGMCICQLLLIILLYIISRKKSSNGNENEG